MTSRAFIVAVEDYPGSDSVCKLPDTIRNAERFAKCIEHQLGIDHDDVIFCCSGNSPRKTHGATWLEISKAIQDLIQVGVNETSQLIVFLSGHGVMKKGKGIPPDINILLCSDFINSTISGRAIIQIDELATVFSQTLGPGTHLWFVDACRTADKTLIATEMGLEFETRANGTADRFHILSAPVGTTATNDSLFVESIIQCLEEDFDPTTNPSNSLSFRDLAKNLGEQFSIRRRKVEFQSRSNQFDYLIDRISADGKTRTIRDDAGYKAVPVELLTQFDEVIFLGETNGQLPKFLKQAFALRNQARWKRLDVLSIEDLSQSGRKRVTLDKLEQERQDTEEFLKANAALMTDATALYRYNSTEYYGSFWKAADGERHVHISPKTEDVDIRMAPATDYFDFPKKQRAIVSSYFAKTNSILNSPDCRRIFSYPN